MDTPENEVKEETRMMLPEPELQELPHGIREKKPPVVPGACSQL
jgi:hypothetical protein